MFKSIKNLLNSANNGYTLIELLVALAIFIIVIIIVSDIFFSGFGGQRKIMAIQLIQENSRYALELMAREIRMSRINTSAGQTEILDITESKNSTNISYFLSTVGETTMIMRQEQGADPQPVTSGAVNVSFLKFYVRENRGNNSFKNVSIVMTVEKSGSQTQERAKINLGTTIVARYYE